MPHLRPTLPALRAAVLAACTGGASSSSSQSAAPARTVRGAIAPPAQRLLARRLEIEGGH